MLVVTVSGSAIEFLRPRGGLPHRRAPRRAHPQALAQAAPGPNGLHKIQMPDLLSTYPTCVPNIQQPPNEGKLIMTTVSPRRRKLDVETISRQSEVTIGQTAAGFEEVQRYLRWFGYLPGRD